MIVNVHPNVERNEPNQKKEEIIVKNEKCDSKTGNEMKKREHAVKIYEQIATIATWTTTIFVIVLHSIMIMAIEFRCVDNSSIYTFDVCVSMSSCLSLSHSFTPPLCVRLCVCVCLSEPLTAVTYKNNIESLCTPNERLLRFLFISNLSFAPVCISQP